MSNPSKKERKLLRRQEREQEKAKNRQKRKIKKFFGYGLAVLVAAGAMFWGSWWISRQKPTSGSEIISQQGIHWHADLSIKILGEFQDVSANIGIGITERYIHTHESNGVIHMEFPGLVKKDDIKLGRFFEIWDKNFNKDCVFDKCSDEERQLKMLANGKENFEFENYVMQDEDKIEIIFE